MFSLSGRSDPDLVPAPQEIWFIALVVDGLDSLIFYALPSENLSRCEKKVVGSVVPIRGFLPVCGAPAPSCVPFRAAWIGEASTQQLA